MTKKEKLILFPILAVLVLGILFWGCRFVSDRGIECYVLKHFGYYCPGCGITRSLTALFKLDIIGCIQFYPSVLFLLIYIFYRYISLIFSVFTAKECEREEVTFTLLILVTLSAIFHWIFINFV